MVFKDRAFCSNSSGIWGKCVNSSCHMNLTPELRKEAEEWWGDMKGHPPIYIGSFITGNCGYME